MYMSLSKGEVEGFFEMHPEYLSREVADAARQDARRAIDQGRHDIVFLAASAAAAICLRLGDRSRFLIDRLDALQGLFMLSETEADYDAVREQALELHGMASEISSQSVTFRSLVLAADCSWFTAEPVTRDQSDEALERRLVRTLEDVLVALRAAGPVVDDPHEHGWVERLASILAVSAQSAMSWMWSNQQDVDRLLRQLAVAADVVPVDLRFERQGSGKAAAVAAVLEQLDSGYR
jgi:hypothetical protein